MSVTRLGTYVPVSSLSGAQFFYGDLLGMVPQFGDERIIVFRPGANATTEILALTHEILTGDLIPQLLVEVDDVDDVYQRAQEAKLEIVYPLKDEEWGVRRFFVRGPNGELANVLAKR